MTDEEKHIERIRRDIPEPDAPHWLGVMLIAAAAFWAAIAVGYVGIKALGWVLFMIYV